MTDNETASGSEPDGPKEFPTTDELPDEPLTADDISPFSVDTDEFADLNELAVAEWKASTTADERIRAVIKRTHRGKSAAEVANEAAVSESKARDTLNTLVAEGIVQAQQTNSGKLYERNPDWYLLQQIRQLAGSQSLIDQIQRMKQELASYREKYGTDSPAEVLVSDSELSETELTDVSHWRTAKQQLSYLRAAYRFQQAREQFTQTNVARDQGHNSESPLDQDTDTPHIK